MTDAEQDAADDAQRLEWANADDDVVRIPAANKG
jgi:hypothetical protein